MDFRSDRNGTFWCEPRVIWYDVKCWSRQPISSVFDHWAVAKHIPNGERSSQQTTTISSIHFDGSQNSRSNFKQLPSKWPTSWWITLYSWTILPLRKAGFPVLANQQLFGTLPDHFVGWFPPTNHFFSTIHYTSTTISSLWNGQACIVGCLRSAWADSWKLFSSSSPAMDSWMILGSTWMWFHRYSTIWQYNFWVWKRVPYHEDIAVFMVG